MDKKTKIFIAVFAAVIAVCAAAYLFLLNQDTGTIAVISVDTVEYETVNLSKVREPYDIVIETEYGSNTVHVEKGSISVSDADCPDKVCVSMGSISTGGIPIVCLPHRLIIQISGGDIDA